MSDTNILPAGFEDLSYLVPLWARSTENERSVVRWAGKKEDFAAFYAAFMPRLNGVLEYLKGVPLADMPDAERNLFHLCCAFAEAAPHHELYAGSPDVPYSFSARRFVPGHGDKPSESAIMN